MDQLFKEMYLGKWPEPSEQDKYLYKLAIEYHKRTETYDRAICTGLIRNNMILPRTGNEMTLINQNAAKIKIELVNRAMNEHGIEQKQVLQAIQRWR
jgi:hypothetical protein